MREKNKMKIEEEKIQDYLDEGYDRMKDDKMTEEDIDEEAEAKARTQA